MFHSGRSWFDTARLAAWRTGEQLYLILSNELNPKRHKVRDSPVENRFLDGVGALG